MTARGSRSRDEQAGYVAVLTAILASTVFLSMAAVGVDISHWYAEGERVQKAADAAALAGVTYLPNDLAGAKAAALLEAQRNGYDDAAANVVVTVGVGDKPSQLKVTVSSLVKNSFGGSIGKYSTWVARSSTADYTAPAPMGSPCNTFGNEPRGDTGTSAPAPTGTALPSSPFANCPKDSTTNTSQPQFWGSVEGPETDKVQGDRYSTRTCTETGNAGATYGCASGLNAEYRSDGSYFVVHVEPGAVNSPIELQVYDPSFVNTGSYCNGDTTSNDYAAAGIPMVPKASALAANMNPYTTTSGKVRYAAWKTPSNTDYTGTDANTGGREYCTGDSFPSYTKTACYYPSRYRSNPCFSTPTNTTFVLRHQTDTDDPTQAVPYTSCIRQYRGYATPPQVSELKSSSTSTYNQQLAQVYHQWVSLCSFTPDKAGNYYLQVRTNVALGGTSNANTNGLNPMIYSGNTAAVAAVGNTTAGAGSNSFGLRAILSTDTLRKLVSVSGWQRMPLLQNAPASTATFNLVRALPNAKGQYLTFDFFDAADGSSGTIKVLPPLDATGTVMSSSGVPGCRAGLDDTAPSTYSSLTGCSVSVTGTSTDGHVMHMVIPIPNDYTCSNSTLGGCWFRVQMNYNGNVTDFTTWSANIGGDPVRLIR